MSIAPKIEVVSPGNRLTVQDLGRRGSQRYGVSVSGVLDVQAAVIANRLVGNPISSALLESTFGGVSLKFEQQTKVAVTGADVSVESGGLPLSTWETLIVPAGGLLSIGMPSRGLYSYISVAGGIDVPTVLGSRSTHVASGIGGFEGRTLLEGDKLPVGTELETTDRPQAGTTAPDDLIPACLDHSRPVRVIKGPQHEAFPDDASGTFFGSTFSVSNLTDRQGARLDGVEIRAKGGKHDIVSDPAYMGAVQIPADGKPIILLADRQPTGGYAKIASVISAHLPAVVQRTPGSEISFELIGIEGAQEIAHGFRQSIIQRPLKEPERTFVSNITMNGELYNIELVHPKNEESQRSDGGIVYATINDEPETVATYESLS